MSDLYVEMLRDSPVQKEWKPSHGDSFVKDSELREVCIFADKQETKDATWLPTQEDWQAKVDLRLRMSAVAKVNLTTSLFDFSTSFEKYCMNRSKEFFKKFQLSHIGKVQEMYTILWCLFVHKEVYGLEWDWEEKKWRRILKDE